MKSGIEVDSVLLDAEAAAVARKAYEVESFRVPGSKETIPELNGDGTITLGATALQPMLDCISENIVLCQRTLDKLNTSSPESSSWKPWHDQQNTRIVSWRNELEYRLGEAWDPRLYYFSKCLKTATSSMQR